MWHFDDAEPLVQHAQAVHGVRVVASIDCRSGGHRIQPLVDGGAPFSAGAGQRLDIDPDAPGGSLARAHI